MMASNRHSKSLGPKVAQAVRQAGEWLRAVWEEAEAKPAASPEVDWKGPSDPVTSWDRTVETMLLSALGRLTPDIPVWSEEGRPVPPNSLGQRWLLDPLDGTLNATHRYPHVAIALALEDAEGIAEAFVYDVHRSHLYWAARGQGAWRDGLALHVGTNPALSQALLAVGATWKDEEAIWQVLARHGQDLRRGGSAALDLAWVASGILDGFVERRLWPWDVAAGSLLVAEAGGLATDLRGSPLRWNGPLAVVAANPSLHRALVEALKDLKTSDSSP
ncbi:MAG: inositol monophosphatase [Firmicutes bacterium]|nr:inositol monophosphatase [Alicyclobacillaceae bacterium]MCL6497630.1 inositol monophosphatase [Bacillota bacterium]